MISVTNYKYSPWHKDVSKVDEENVPTVSILFTPAFVLAKTEMKAIAALIGGH